VIVGFVRIVTIVDIDEIVGIVGVFGIVGIVSTVGIVGIVGITTARYYQIRASMCVYGPVRPDTAISGEVRINSWVAGM
jgi:hypothetical protein